MSAVVAGLGLTVVFVPVGLVSSLSLSLFLCLSLCLSVSTATGYNINSSPKLGHDLVGVR